MSNDPTRKHFLAQFLGLIATVGLAPKLLIGSARAVAVPAVPVTRLRIRPESRAVARHADSL